MFKKLFTVNGQNYAFTFALVCSLFLLWGFCNGMIDVMDKHFQNELKLSLSQSAWVQFAHYLGYFLMAMPAGWLASRLGYKGGIILGLLMVAGGGFWFIPATKIAAFWAFLLGVCLIAAGLTFLETVANPYSTVLGAQEFAATRINLAQSCNGIGWIFGPLAGAMFFYSTDSSGQHTGAETLWIPYAAVGVVVAILAVVFLRARMPDLTPPDDYHLAETDSDEPSATYNRPLSLALIWLNLLILSASTGMIISAIATIFDPDESHALRIFLAGSGVVMLIATVIFFLRRHALTPHSIWAQPHFSSATIVQFFYVAAQAGVFAYFINYMTSQAPAAITDKAASGLASVAFLCFLIGRMVGAALLGRFPAHRVLFFFAIANVATSLLVVLKLGWLSVVCVFLIYFFMSLMFPTIFALGIHGLGARGKKASSYIVMAIMGGAIVPKLMGHIADHHGMSVGFIVPLACFLVVGCYGYFWNTLCGADAQPRAQG